MELVEDGLLGGNHRADIQLGDTLDIVHGQNVQRVGHRQEEFVVHPGDGDDLVVLAHVARNQFGDLLRDAQADQVDGRNLEYTAHRDTEVQVGHEALVDDDLVKAGAFPLLLLDQFLELLGEEQAVFDEGLSDAFSESFNSGHGGSRLADDFFDDFEQFGGMHQVPNQSLLGGFLQFERGLLVEGIGRGNEYRFAHAVEEKHAPAFERA